MYTAHIRHNPSGEIREKQIDLDWEKDDGWTDEFWWAEGNNSCDCNRHLDFGRAIDPSFNEDHPCGDDVYTIIKIVSEGETVYTEV